MSMVMDRPYGVIVSMVTRMASLATCFCFFPHKDSDSTHPTGDLSSISMEAPLLSGYCSANFCITAIDLIGNHSVQWPYRSPWDFKAQDAPVCAEAMITFTWPTP